MHNHTSAPPPPPTVPYFLVFSRHHRNSRGSYPFPRSRADLYLPMSLSDSMIAQQRSRIEAEAQTTQYINLVRPALNECTTVSLKGYRWRCRGLFISMIRIYISIYYRICCCIVFMSTPRSRGSSNRYTNNNRTNNNNNNNNNSTYIKNHIT